MKFGYTTRSVLYGRGYVYINTLNNLQRQGWLLNVKHIFLKHKINAEVCSVHHRCH